MARPKKTQRPRPRKKKQRKESTCLEEVGLLLDFCNVRKWNQESLREFYRKHGFTGIVCRTRNCKDWFALEEDEDLRKLNESRTKTSGPGIIFPSDEHYDHLLQTNLLISQDKYERDFLEKCIAGQLDLAVLNRMVVELDWEKPQFVSDSGPEHSNMKFVASSDAWKPDLHFDFTERTIESVIEQRIVNVFMRKEGGVFSRIGKCPACSLYFPKRRPDHKYCKKQCSQEVRNKRYTDSGKRAEFMRKGRFEGKYL